MSFGKFSPRVKRRKERMRRREEKSFKTALWYLSIVASVTVLMYMNSPKLLDWGHRYGREGWFHLLIGGAGIAALVVVNYLNQHRYKYAALKAEGHRRRYLPLLEVMAGWYADLWFLFSIILVLFLLSLPYKHFLGL